jgi:hypothetical protein
LRFDAFAYWDYHASDRGHHDDAHPKSLADRSAVGDPRPEAWRAALAKKTYAGDATVNALDAVGHGVGVGLHVGVERTN